MPCSPPRNLWLTAARNRDRKATSSQNVNRVTDAPACDRRACRRSICVLLPAPSIPEKLMTSGFELGSMPISYAWFLTPGLDDDRKRSEERRVGEEGRTRWAP